MNTREKKNFNYFKFVWVVGLFSILILILVIVMNYKVYYETQIGYMYFYDCSNSVCTSYKKEDVGDSVVFSKYRYGDKIPEVLMLEGNYAVINDNVLYNYVMGKVVTSDYDDYKVAGSNLIVTKGDKLGVIDSSANELVPVIYNEISSNDGIYFVVDGSNDSSNLIDSSNNIILEGYSYIYEYSNVIVLVKDMVLSIKDINGNDLIGRTLEVYDENELVSVSNDNNVLYIKIYVGEQYYKYTYNIDTQELVNLTQ